MDSAIVDFLKPHKDKLDELYQWKFNEEIPHKLFGISVSGNAWLEKTRDLKEQLISKIQNAESDKELVKLAEYFIKDWGGIKRFSKSREIVSQFSSIAGSGERPDDFTAPYKSISSWSKWVSLICPDWACIYDARVAYTLNTINYLSGGAHKIFPMPQGQNTKLKMLDVTTLLVASKAKLKDNTKPRDLRDKYFIEESDAYREYLHVINLASQQLWGNNGDINDIEMLLFSIADNFAYESLFKAVSGVNS